MGRLKMVMSFVLCRVLRSHSPSGLIFHTCGSSYSNCDRCDRTLRYDGKVWRLESEDR